MKNPWGEKEWNGPWSDGSGEWTPESIKELGHTFGNDGIFWIRYKDVLRKYPVIWRTRLFTPEWKVVQKWTSLEVPWAGYYQDTKFEITITKQTPTVIVLSKLDSRYFHGLAGQYVFQLSFRVHQAGEKDYIMRSFGEEALIRSTSCEMTLEPGKYEVRLKITAHRDDTVPKLEDVVKDKWLTDRNKLLKAGLSHGLAHAKAHVVKEEEKPKEPLTETSATLSTVENDKREATMPEISVMEPGKISSTQELIGDKGVASIEAMGYAPVSRSGHAHDDLDVQGKREEKTDVPWCAVAVVGLRVYCKDEDATIKIVTPKLPVVAGAKLDLDDPARDASEGVDVKDKGKDEVEEKKDMEGKKDEESKKDVEDKVDVDDKLDGEDNRKLELKVAVEGKEEIECKKDVEDKKHIGGMEREGVEINMEKEEVKRAVEERRHEEKNEK